jgi:PA14 domain-containing protein
MRKLSFPVAFVVAAAATVATAGCSFEVGSKPPPATPAPVAPANGAPAPAANKPVVHLGRTPSTTPPGGTVLVTPVRPGVPPASPGTPGSTPAGMPVLSGTNVFGQGTPDAAGWKGSYFAIAAGTTKVPALATLTPTGVLFAHDLNVAAKPMTGGFPGIDASRNENFAIRWEAPLIVDTESDYTFRIVSDDGAIVQIDGTPIVDNDGAHGVQEKSGPVHLVRGTHILSVDYFQTTGSVALQLFCKKASGTETICPTHLL